jgi:hypothetical protein
MSQFLKFDLTDRSIRFQPIPAITLGKVQSFVNDCLAAANLLKSREMD